MIRLSLIAEDYDIVSSSRQPDQLNYQRKMLNIWCVSYLLEVLHSANRILQNLSNLVLVPQMAEMAKVEVVRG